MAASSAVERQVQAAADEDALPGMKGQLVDLLAALQRETEIIDGIIREQNTAADVVAVRAAEVAKQEELLNRLFQGNSLVTRCKFIFFQCSIETTHGPTAAGGVGSLRRNHALHISTHTHARRAASGAGSTDRGYHKERWPGARDAHAAVRLPQPPADGGEDGRKARGEAHPPR